MTPLQARAIAHLEAAMTKEDGLPRIHAGDALVAVGDPLPAHASFASDSPANGNPAYRTGVWRIRAKSAQTPAEKAKWVGRLESVAVDPAAKDRLQAIEGLGKVGAPISDATRKVLRALADANGRERPFCLWALAANGDPMTAPKVMVLLDSPFDVDRLRAAYILRHLRSTDPQILTAVAKAAAHEPEGSPAWIYVQGAALVLHADPANNATIRDRVWKTYLGGAAGERYEAAQALGAAKAVPESAFEPALKESGDPGIGAAWAILALR